MSNVGFIGLGIMGTPMADHLLQGGHRLFLHSRSGIPRELLDGGGVSCANGQEVAEKSDIIITMVPDTPHVEGILSSLGGEILAPARDCPHPLSESKVRCSGTWP